MQKIQLTYAKIMENIKFASFTFPFFVWVYNNAITKNAAPVKNQFTGAAIYLGCDFNSVLFHPTIDLEHICNGLWNLH